MFLETIAQYAEQILSDFTLIKDSDPNAIPLRWRCKNPSTERQDLFFECHLGMLPNDWSYALIFEALNYLVDYEIKDKEDFEEKTGDFYCKEYTNYEMCSWMCSDNYRMEIIDEAINEMGVEATAEIRIKQRVEIGYLSELRKIIDLIIEAATEKIEADKEEWERIALPETTVPFNLLEI